MCSWLELQSKDNNHQIEQCIKRSTSKNDKRIEGLKKSFLLDEHMNHKKLKLRNIESKSSVNSHIETEIEKLETAFYNCQRSLVTSCISIEH